MADRFDEVAMPLLMARLMTTRGLTLNICKHIPAHISGFTMSAMHKEDKNRTRRGETLVNKDELIAMALEEEGLLLDFEAEMRAASQVPNPRTPVSPSGPRRA